MKVLITDDSLLANHAIKSYFFKLGHEVVGLAKNGTIAQTIFQETLPDLITVDAVMPGMSGAEFIRWVNEFDAKHGRETKILMISSDEVAADVRRDIRVDKYIIKPITMQKVDDALKSL